MLLYEKLAEILGREKIFKDIDNFSPGDNFPVLLSERLSGADIVLAVIGPNWSVYDPIREERRLDNPEDWVRIEIGSALKQNKLVVPVRVNGAPVLKAEELPDDLKPLANTHSQLLSNDKFVPEAKTLGQFLAKQLVDIEAEKAASEAASGRTGKKASRATGETPKSKRSARRSQK